MKTIPKKLICVPYDSGQKNVRLGLGPQHLLKNGLLEILGIETVDVEWVSICDSFPLEVKSSFKLFSALAASVRFAISNGNFPVLLCGNCAVSLNGGPHGFNQIEDLGLVLFDAHGEFNNPETTTTGYLDGMGLAIATGQCWKTLAEREFASKRRIEPENAYLIGATNLDDLEKADLTRCKVNVLFSAEVVASQNSKVVSNFARSVGRTSESIYLHIDFDVLDPSYLNASQYSCNGGLSPSQVVMTVREICKHTNVIGIGFAGLDPSVDRRGQAVKTCVTLVQQIVEEVTKHLDENKWPQALPSKPT